MLYFQIWLSGHSRQTELMNGEAGRKSTLKVSTNPWLINRNTPFSNSVATGQLNVLIIINMSNYRHCLMTEVYWNMNIIFETAMLRIWPTTYYTHLGWQRAVVWSQEYSFKNKEFQAKFLKPVYLLHISILKMWPPPQPLPTWSLALTS